MSNQIPLYHLDEIGEQHPGVAVFHFANPPLVDYSSEISQPHRHDHYCCFFIEEGHMDLDIDFQPVRISESSILISYPGQVHHSNPNQDCSGWMLIFDGKMVNENSKMTIEGSGRHLALITLSKSKSDWFRKLFEILHAVVADHDDMLLRAQLTRSLLDAFVYQICILSQSSEQTLRKDHSSRSVDIANQFRHLVKKNFKTLKRPVEYAEKMNFSVRYLNDTVKAVTGFPVTYFIQQEVIAEAQRLLYYSGMTIRQIADILGYEDDKYFIRLFSKSTGISPTNFRRSQKPQ